MDLHQSTNQNLYLRQSYLSQAGLPRPNLESRIVYAENERSFSRWIKFGLALLALLVALYFLRGLFGIGSNAQDVCYDAGSGSTGSWFSSLFQRLFGFGGPSRCNLKKEVLSEESADKTVMTVKEIRRCPIDGQTDDEGDGWSLWNWFRKPNPECDKVRAHEAALAKIRPTIKPFSVIPPSLRDIQTFPSKYAQFRKFANETENPNLRADVQFLFDEIDRDRNWATVVHNRDVTHPDFVAPLTHLDNLLAIQKKAKDLNDSGRILADKDATIDRLRADFTGKATERNCADQMAELMRAHKIYVEKKAYSSGVLDGLRAQLRDIQLKIQDSLNRKYQDSNGPMAQLGRVEKEVSALHTAKARIAPKVDDGANSLPALERNRLLTLEQKIRSNLDEIGAIDGRDALAAQKIREAKERFDGILVSLGTLRYKLSVSLRNSEIKEFLSSILKQGGSEKTLEQYFAETETSKQEIVRIVRAFLNKSKGMDTVEINWSEAEWNEAIERDQREFQEILKVYHELRDMINKYKDVEINITAYKRDIAQKEKERDEAEAEWKAAQARQRIDTDRRRALEEDNDRLRIEIKGLQQRIADLEREVSSYRAELSQIESNLAAKLAAKAELDAQNRNLVDEFNRENAVLRAQEKELTDKIDDESKHLRTFETDAQRILFDVERLKEACAHFLIFEYLLREFLRVAKPELTNDRRVVTELKNTFSKSFKPT